MSQRYDGDALGACKKLINHTHKHLLNTNMNTPLHGMGLDDYTPGEEIRVCVFKDDNTCHELEYNPFFHPKSEYAFPKQTSVHCVYDANEDGNIDWTDGSHVIHFGQITPQPHCFCTAKGPHSEVTNEDWDPVEPAWKRQIEYSLEHFQHVFQTGLKDHILERNWVENGSVIKNGKKVFKSEAIYANSTTETFDPNPELQKWNKDDATAAQIDHIIPRKDSQGCLCGDPTSNNAAVISLELNQTMSNISPKYNEDRARMYAKYVTCPDPSVAQFEGKGTQSSLLALGFTHLQDDESTMCVYNEDDRFPEPPADPTVKYRLADDTGGCSTGGPLGLGAGLVLLAMRRRRHRRRS